MAVEVRVRKPVAADKWLNLDDATLIPMLWLAIQISLRNLTKTMSLSEMLASPHANVRLLADFLLAVSEADALAYKYEYVKIDTKEGVVYGWDQAGPLALGWSGERKLVIPRCPYKAIGWYQKDQTVAAILQNGVTMRQEVEYNKTIYGYLRRKLPLKMLRFDPLTKAVDVDFLPDSTGSETVRL